MTNEELKKKICDIIALYVSAYGDDEHISDELIAAGLKFDVLTETEYQKYCAYKIIEPQIKGCLDREKELEKRLAEAEHRAEVAERALKDCVEYYSYSGLCPVLDCNYNKACWRKECTSDIAKCFKIQAEKELAEESKDD